MNKVVLRVRTKRWLGVQPVAWATSFTFHVTVLITALVLNSLPAASTDLAQEARPRTERKFVVLTLNQSLPAIAPPKPVEPPGGARHKAKKTFRVRTPKPSAADQMIWNPKVPKILDKTVPMPNLVAASMEMAVPAPPPPAPKVARKFEAPPARKRAQPQLAPAAVELLETPKVTVDQPKIAAGSVGGLTGNSKLPPAPFSGPRGKTRTAPKMDVSSGVEPDIVVQAAHSGAAADFIAKQGVDIAVLAPTPSDRAPSVVPEGNRGASISQGALEAKTGDATPTPGATRIPGLDVTTEGSTTAPSGSSANGVASAAALAAQFTAVSVMTPRTQIDMKRSLYSVPFSERGGSAGEVIRGKFGPRRFYLSILDRPNPTHYSRDWYLWFAESKPLPGDSPQINPPIPVRLVDPIGPRSPLRKSYQGTILLSAIIRANGFVDNISVLKGVDDAVDEAARQAFVRTTFLPALRSGIKTEIEVVLEIPVAAKP